MPGRAAWPSASLTPRYFGFDVLRFFADPPAFVLAIMLSFSDMSIPERITRGKDALLIGILVLSSTASFGLGVLAGREQGRGAPEDDFWIEQLGEPVQSEPAGATLPTASGAAGAAAVGAAASSAAPQAPAKPVAPAPAAGAYVASKTGTKYYLPWCGTASRIKEENKVWFETKAEAEAEAAGYQPAANCKGL